MSVTIQLDLPEALLNEARANGLLESDSMGDLLVAELRRRKAAAGLRQVLDQVRSQPGAPMTTEEIAAEVKAARRNGADTRTQPEIHSPEFRIQVGG